MSTCPYFLRGNCRYGDRCRLPHEPRAHRPQNPPFRSHEPHGHHTQNPQFRPHEPRGHHAQNPPFRPHEPRGHHAHNPIHRPRAPFNSNYNYVAPSYPNNQNHHAQNKGESGRTIYKYQAIFTWVKENFANQEKALDILSELQREAKVWQKSEHLWRFTSKCLFPGGQPLEGWHDQSFEEVKWTHRQMTSQDQEHIYKKAYYDYYENIVRQLNDLATLKLDRLILLKDYIRQYVESNYKPSKTLSTDVEMNDGTGNATMESFHQTESSNYTPDDQILDDERAAFQRDTFEFGQIPAHAPSQQYC